MKVKFYLFTIIILFFATSNFSQECRESNKSDLLAEDIKVGKFESILVAGDSNDKCLIPYLRTLSSKNTGVGRYAQIALAKLGDEKAVKDILDEVDFELANEKSTESKFQGIEKLSMVGGKVAFRKFYKILCDAKPLPETTNEQNEPSHRTRKLKPKGYPLSVYVVMTHLKGMVSNPPNLSSRNNINFVDDLINHWKKWFEDHKYLID